MSITMPIIMTITMTVTMTITARVSFTLTLTPNRHSTAASNHHPNHYPNHPLIITQQALYYCLPMRAHCLQHAEAMLAKSASTRAREGATSMDAEVEVEEVENLFSSMCELFFAIAAQRKRCGVLAPRPVSHLPISPSVTLPSFL